MDSEVVQHHPYLLRRRVSFICQPPLPLSEVNHGDAGFGHCHMPARPGLASAGMNRFRVPWPADTRNRIVPAVPAWLESETSSSGSATALEVSSRPLVALGPWFRVKVQHILPGHKLGTHLGNTPDPFSATA